jgi:hypothetical protein
VFPWDHLDFGVTREYLEAERLAAEKGETTADCRRVCHDCGILAFEEGLCIETE